MLTSYPAQTFNHFWSVNFKWVPCEPLPEHEKVHCIRKNFVFLHAHPEDDTTTHPKDKHFFTFLPDYLRVFSMTAQGYLHPSYSGVNIIMQDT